MVTGSTLAEIRQSLRQARSSKEKLAHEGFTTWRIDWQFVTKSEAGGCRCRAFHTATTIAVTLPRWTPPANTPPAVEKAWARYLAALTEHEQGHVQIARAAVLELHRQVKQLAAEPDCDSMQEKLNTRAQHIVEAYRQRDKDYDQRTAHGIKQGASLTPFPRDGGGERH